MEHDLRREIMEKNESAKKRFERRVGNILVFLCALGLIVVIIMHFTIGQEHRDRDRINIQHV